jgi:hypothetical protein
MDEAGRRASLKSARIVSYDPQRTSSSVEYRLTVRLRDGRVVPSAPLLTAHRRHLGDEVRIPLRPDGELRPGEIHAWRVAAVGDGGDVLLLEHVAPEGDS